ncbi:MAG: nucleoside deaminase [Planctomycetota bacterium]
MNDQELMNAAFDQAKKSYDEGGIPIGAVLADAEGNIVSAGHNRRVQHGDPTAHGEMNCIRNAGRRRDWTTLTLYTTLSPCIMCSGAAMLFRIPRIVIGENKNFMGEEALLQSRGVEVTVLDDPACTEIMSRFIREQPDVWNEDIGL